MVKAVLTTKPQSKYDDLNPHRYHFPRTYLNQIEKCVGDWIVYYEPRRLSTVLNKTGGRQAYFAVAKVSKIQRDQNADNHFYAYMEEYLEFDHPVSFKEEHGYYESSLMKVDGSTNKGAFGRSVRNIPEREYEAIMSAGFELAMIGEDAYYGQSNKVQNTVAAVKGFSENDQAPYERPIIESLTKRPFRDAAFRHVVRNAYDMTCAMTGLKLINGGGRPEVQAAHIRPVANNGPDFVGNGIALSSTMHWMFDRGLISIDEDYTIMKVKKGLPQQVEGILNLSGKLILPIDSNCRPHPKFLEFHREQVFKG